MENEQNTRIFHLKFEDFKNFCSEIKLERSCLELILNFIKFKGRGSSF